MEGLHASIVGGLGLCNIGGLGLGDGLGVGISGGSGRVISLDSRVGTSKNGGTEEGPRRGEEARSRAKGSHGGG